MKRLVLWCAKLYPTAWHRRYDTEFEAFLEDSEPTWQDVFDVLFRAVTSSLAATYSEVMLPNTSARQRLTVRISLLVHASLLSVFFISSWTRIAPLPADRWLAAPLPPPAPAPPASITDPRVLQDAGATYSATYSSLPVSESGSRLIEGVGMAFPLPPDLGSIDRSARPIRRIWAATALESNLVRRVIPEYPRGRHSSDAASVYLEYVIRVDGSVKVLRSQGPEPFVTVSRAALERWKYNSVRFEDDFIEVICRVEFRFDGQLAGLSR